MNLGTPIAIGNTAKVYLYENKIVKVFNDNLPDMESINEAYKQKMAYSCGLSVPKVMDVTKIEGKQAIIMEYIEGKTIGAIISNNIEQAEHYMNICVDVQQRIHQNEARSIEQMSEKLSRQIENAPNLENKLKLVLLGKLDMMTFEKRLCHGDFHPFNLIMSENRVVIIDWVDSSAGDLRADIYRTYLLCSQFSEELAKMYMHLCCEKYGLSKDEIFQWAPIIAAARLSEGVSSENSERLIEIVNYYCTTN
ncbi:aminoglycoside phosphotransferase family protein [Bacillus sp. Marseille-Q3570]|uniref:aminoglycoside phosphotransferase family protein n=1 Tax=Bacillus sp. Marseille-Q3570 TaxID=2963522 RepID=UPI0021B71D3F|nr:aminoglycoside phosphotransferase family protein [Bacillus sp. Marseille-Q3570]